MTADWQSGVFNKPCLDADDQVPYKQQQQLDIAITDDDASTVIHVRGSCARMSDLGYVFDKLGVDVISCSTMPSAGSCDMTLVVVDRHDSQPLDDCLKQSVRQGLRSVLCVNTSNNHCSSDLQHCGPSSMASPSAGTPLQRMQQAVQQPAAKLCLRTAEDSEAMQDLCRADSASEAIQSGRVCSRQLSLIDAFQQQLTAEQQQQRHDQVTSNEAAGAAGTSPRQLAASNSHSSAAFRLLPPCSEAAGTPPPIRSTTHSICKPALTIHIPAGDSMNHSTKCMQRMSIAQQEGTSIDAAALPEAISCGSSLAERQLGLHAQDLAQRLLSLGLHQREPTALVMEDSSDDDDLQGHPISRGSSKSRSGADWQRWQGPVPVPGSSLTAPSMLSQQSGSFSSSTEPTPGKTVSITAAKAAVAAEVEAAFAAAGRSVPSCRERTSSSDEVLPRLWPSSVGGRMSIDTPAGDFGEPGQQLLAASPGIGKPRRRPPPRTPSRIILSPVAPDGTTDPQGQPKLFVAIPKQPVEEKRARRPVMRSATVSAAATPSSAGRHSVLQALLGAQGSLPKLGLEAPSPKVAAAAAAASIPYNVAVAAAQLLGKDGSNREAAAAAAAVAAAAASEQPGSPLGSPLSIAPPSAGSSEEFLSPMAATPKGLPPPPATPVHPAVVAAAAAVIKAAAKEADNAALAAALDREPLASCVILEEGEEGSSTAEEAGYVTDADHSEAGDSSSSEEWWCGSVSGLTVRDIMTGPLQVVSQDADVAVARQVMVQHNLLGILVDTGPGSEPGFLTRRDFFKAQLTRRGHKRRHPKTVVRDIMSHPVIAFDASEAIEVCAQMMQERGIRRAAVRDRTAADSAQHLSEYVGLVSDASIFRCLGLYAEEGTVLEEEDHGLLGVPAALRLNSAHGVDSSIDGSGIDTPFGGSRATTPIANVDRSGQQHDQQDKGVAESVSVLNAANQVPSSAFVMSKQQTLPDAAAHGCLQPGSSLSSGTSGSMADGLEGSTLAETAAGQPIQVVNDSKALAAAANTNPDSTPGSLAAACGPLDQSKSSDALSRYRTAASLWEVDVSEMDMIKRIGEGSFGEVMLANYRGTKVAVKRLRVLDVDDAVAPNQCVNSSSSTGTGGSTNPSESSRPGCSQAAFRQFFEREIAILASIRHPNVVNFIGACHTPGQRCLVTEYCARGSLDQVLHKSGMQLDLPKRVEFAMDVARGMACLHAQRPIIIHRDLKTANLLVSARFEVKVADFGLSRIKDASHLQVSRAGLEGTIEYCAPEVLRGEPYTERCDVYSFGVVLWELLLRQRPYADADVPIFLLMVNIGNGSLKLPEIPVESATPGLVSLTEQCLAFSAADRPDFREVLQLLETEYRGLRAAQHKQSRQPSIQQQVQQQQEGVLRCDSASSLAVQQQSPRVTADTADTGAAPAMHSRAGSGNSQGLMPSALPTATGAVSQHSADGGPFHAAVGPDGMAYQDPYVFHQQQQQHYYLQPQGVLQFHQPDVQHQQQQQQQHLHQQRSRLGHGDSLGFPAGNISAGGSTAHVLPAGVQYVYADQQQHHMVSVPLPQLVVPQQQHYVATAHSAAASTVSSPHAHLNQQSAFPQGSGVCVLSAFSVAPHQQQQQVTPSTAGAGSTNTGMVGSSSKPPRQKQLMSRARSMPIPQSINWEEDEQNDTHGPDSSVAGDVGGTLLMEDSFGNSEHAGNTPGMRCMSAFPAAGPSGQLCMVLDPAAAHSGMMPQPLGYNASPGGVYYAHAQQPVLVTHSGPVPVVFAQPGYVQYAQAQPQQHVHQLQQTTLQQQVQCQQQPPPHMMQSQQRMLPRGLFTPSPTPAALATPPLSSSPSLNNPNPLAVMAAVGAAAAAARREGSINSGAASPTMLQGGSFAAHRRSSSQGGCIKQAPSQLSEMGSPTASARERRGSDAGHAAPHAAVAPLLLQRLDSLPRSGSASPRSCSSCGQCLLPGPALQSEHSGQLMGVMINSGPPSGNGSPLGGPHMLVGHRHTGSSRLAIQGSYDMSHGGSGYATPVRQGSGGSMNGEGCHAFGSPASGPSFLHQPHQHIQGVTKRPSLLRIDSNCKDKAASPFASPFAVAEGYAASSAGHYRSPYASDGGSTGASPFGSVSGNAPVAPAFAAFAASGAPAPSPFAAAAARSPFAAASGGSNSNSGGSKHSNVAGASPFAAVSGAPLPTDDAETRTVYNSSRNAHTTTAGAAASSPASASGATSRFASAFAAVSNLFAAATGHMAAAAQPQPTEQEGADVSTVDDTSPWHPQQAHGFEHVGGNRGIRAAGKDSKPAISPFALVSQSEEHDDNC